MAWWSDLDPAVNVSTVFGHLPFEQRPTAVRSAGFGRLESWWPFATLEPGPRERDQFTNTIRDAGLQLIALNAYAGELSASERGLASVPGERDRFLRAVENAFAIGTEMDCHRFNILAGVANSRPAAEVEEQAVEGLSIIAKRAAELGHTVLLEVLNNVDNPDYSVTDVTTALRWIDRVRTESRTEAIALLYDTYHLAMQGEDPTEAARRSAGVIGHVQFADSPGRSAPGSGTIDFPAVLTALTSAGYNGPIALEYFPADLAHPFEWMATH